MIIFILLSRYKTNTIENNHPFLTVLDVGTSKVKARVDLVSAEVLLVILWLRPRLAEGGGYALGCPL